MTRSGSASTVEQIPIDLIDVINPRARNRRVFKEIVENIAQLGLKRPITVAKRTDGEGIRYDLVCGQGRLEAYRHLGQTQIPALVVDASGEDCLIMSLVENLARRQRRALDLLHDVEGLKRRGYNEVEIARKTDLSPEYVRAVIRLLEKGEIRLLQAVESGHIPVSVAVEIAETDEVGAQRALQHAYEKNLLRGWKLRLAQQLVDRRQRRGKKFRAPQKKREQPLSSAALLRAYNESADKKRMLVHRAEATHGKLVSVIEALRKLLNDEHFVTLLRAEGLESLPRNLASRLQTAEGL